MLRLRTTVVLSLLALAVGVVGTDWLSDRSTNEPLAMPWVAKVNRPMPSRHHPARPSPHVRAFGDAPHIHRSRMDRSSVTADQNRGNQAASAALPPELVPLDMPIHRDVAYDQLRGHLDGRVVMHVSVDGGGRVAAASVAESSGDAELDAHALRSVRNWRFAVPPDHPDGLSADLPMRFSSRDDPVASLP